MNEAVLACLWTDAEKFLPVLKHIMNKAVLACDMTDDVQMSSCMSSTDNEHSCSCITFDR